MSPRRTGTSSSTSGTRKRGQHARPDGCTLKMWHSFFAFLVTERNLECSPGATMLTHFSLQILHPTFLVICMRNCYGSVHSQLMPSVPDSGISNSSPLPPTRTTRLAREGHLPNVSGKYGRGDVTQWVPGPKRKMQAKLLTAGFLWIAQLSSRARVPFSNIFAVSSGKYTFSLEVGVLPSVTSSYFLMVLNFLPAIHPGWRYSFIMNYPGVVRGNSFSCPHRLYRYYLPIQNGHICIAFAIPFISNERYASAVGRHNCITLSVVISFPEVAT